MSTEITEVVICRTCVGECKEYKSLYKQGLIMGEVTTLASLLSFCTNLEFLEDDSSTFPIFICNNCVHELAKSYAFKKKVLESHKILSSQIEIDRGSGAEEEEVKKQTKENVIVNEESEADLQELAEAAQMKREQLEQQLYDNDEEYLQLTVLDNDGEVENQEQQEEEHNIEEQEEIEMEYVVQDVAETTEIYDTTIITDSEIQHMDEDEEMEQEQEQEQELRESEDIGGQEEKVEYEIQVHDEDYVELISDSQDGMSQQSFKRPADDATNSGSENNVGNPTRRRRTFSGKPANPEHQCKVINAIIKGISIKK